MHTPGLEHINRQAFVAPPWYATRVFKDHKGCYIATVYNDQTREGTGIAQVIAPTESLCGATSILIAAAPRLLEALEAIYRVAKVSSLPGPVLLSIEEVYAARDAIAEAKGE